MDNQKQIMHDLQGKPRMFRNKTYVYPIKMRDALDFYDAVTVFNIDKNSIDDVKILQMSYLRFLLQVSYPKETHYLRERLFTLLKLVFNTDDVDIGVTLEDEYASLSEHPEYCFADEVNCVIRINDSIEITEFDFGKLKTVISEQNMVELNSDEYQSKEFKEAMERAKKFMEKRNGKAAPLDERILAYQYEMKCSLNDVFDLTLYQFNRSLESIAHIKNSDMLQHAVYSGMVSPKDSSKLPTWLSAIERNKEDSLLVDASELTGKLNSVFS